MRASLFTASVFALALSSSTAFGEPSEAEKRTAAEAIFAKANELLAKKDFAAACPKLEEVTKLQPLGVGAKMSLADCYLALGKLASARAMYGEAASLAAQANQPDRASSAQDKSQALEPRLSKLTINVGPALAATRGLSVVRDGSEVVKSLYGLTTPMDGGPHVIRATAPHKKPFEKRLDLANEGMSISVDVVLEDERPESFAAPATGDVTPVAPVHEPAVTPSRGGMHPVRIAGFVVGGLGLALVGVGVGVGVSGVSDANQAAKLGAAAAKSGNKAGSDAARSAYDSGNAQGTAGWVVVGVGGAALVTGTIMAIAAPNAKTPATGATALSIAPWWDQRSGGATLEGRW